MKKKLISLLLAVVMTVAMLPVTALADEPQTPAAPQNAETVTIDGAVLTDGMGWDNDGTTTENGSKSNNAYFKDGTLYLTDLNIECAGMDAIAVSDGSITIALAGENSICAESTADRSQYSAITFAGDPENDDIGTGTISFTGEDGLLQIESGYAGITAAKGKTMNITETVLLITAEWYGLSMNDGSMTDSLLTIESGYIALGADALTINGCITALVGEQAGISAHTLDIRESVVAAGGNYGSAIHSTYDTPGAISFTDSLVELVARYGDTPAIVTNGTVNLNGMQARAGVSALDAKAVSNFDTTFQQYGYALIADDPDSYMEWENAYDDIEEDKWYYNAVAYASQYGLMNGVGNDLFNPNGKVSRSQAVQMMYNLNTEYPRQYGLAPYLSDLTPSDILQLKHFSDVATGTWYEEAVLWGGNSGVVNGVGDNKFNPNGDVTREQFATILYNFAGKLNVASNVSGNLNQFKDAKKVSVWAKDAMQWAVGAKIMNGSDKGMLNPNGTLSRAEAATMLQNFIGATLK